MQCFYRSQKWRANLKQKKIDFLILFFEKNKSGTRGVNWQLTTSFRPGYGEPESGLFSRTGTGAIRRPSRVTLAWVGDSIGPPARCRPGEDERASE
jgi:hypothetical protein